MFFKLKVFHRVTSVLCTLPVVVRIARVDGGRRRRFAGTEMVREVAFVRMSR